MRLIDNVEVRATVFDPLFRLCERMEDVDRMIALVRCSDSSYKCVISMT